MSETTTKGTGNPLADAPSAEATAASVAAAVTASAAPSAPAPEPPYTTGQLARLCGTTVRTVQYYDERGLLAPIARSEGDRRQYDDASAERLREILLLKGLGLPLASIREVCADGAAPQLIERVLTEQAARLDDEIGERVEARSTIAYLLGELRATGTLPATTQADVDIIMDANKQLVRTRIQLGLMLAAFILAMVALAWFAEGGQFTRTTKGLHLPDDPLEVLGLVAALAFVAFFSWFYFTRIAYECPSCHTVFRPKLGAAVVAFHTPTTRKLTCPHCGEKGWCVEVSAVRLHEGE